MDLKKLTIQEIDYDFWLRGRLFAGGNNQHEFVHRDKRIGYGLIIDPLKYKNFVEAFEDIKPNDTWIDTLWMEYTENGNKKREQYSNGTLGLMIRGEIPTERNKLMRILEQANKISIGIKPQNNHKTRDHFYFRKNCSSVYSDSVRINPLQLNKFSFWGFHNPNIFFIKTDFFPGFNFPKGNIELKGGKRK